MAPSAGGAINYIVHRNMIGGYGLVAWPARYDDFWNARGRALALYPPSSLGMKKTSQPGRIGWK